MDAISSDSPGHHLLLDDRGKHDHLISACQTSIASPGKCRDTEQLTERERKKNNVWILKRLYYYIHAQEFVWNSSAVLDSSKRFVDLITIYL